METREALGDLIPLADAIRELRMEVNAAVKAAAGEALKFEVGPIDLEFNVVVTREGSGGGKIGFKIFGWGAEANLGGKLSNAQTHKVKFVLKPLDASGKNPLVSGGGAYSAR
jgi:hypothetical protein